MYAGVYVRLEQAVSGLFKNLQAVWGFSGLYCECLGIVGLQPTLQSAPLTAQSARYICPCDYTQTKQFLFAINRSPQLKTISKVSRRSFVRSSGNAFHQLTICALFSVEAGTRHGHLK